MYIKLMDQVMKVTERVIAKLIRERELRIDILLYFQPIEALFIVTACAAAPFVGFVYRDCVRRRSICWVCCRIQFQKFIDDAAMLYCL